VSVTRLPSGRWRAQVYDPATGKNLSVSKVVGGPGTFATKTEAKRAREKARERLGIVRARDVTVRSFWERWITDPLFARPKESSDIRRRELTKSFAERYGDVPIIQIGDEIVALLHEIGHPRDAVSAFASNVFRRMRSNPAMRVAFARTVLTEAIWAHTAGARRALDLRCA